MIKDAKKWKAMVTTWDMFFYISYGLALLTCFIVDVATSGTLSWFWIVFFALLLASTFTTLPKFIKIFRLILVPFSQLLSLIILLAVCNCFTRGDWLFVATIPIVFAFIVVFLPIVINHYQMPAWVEKHTAIITFVIDSILLILMLCYINFFTNGTWFVGFALPLTLICLTLPLLIIVILNYTKINQFFKNSLCFALSVIFSCFIFPIVNSMVYETFGIPKQEYSINLLYWGAEEFITGNIMFLTISILALFALIYAILGFSKTKK